MPELKNIKNKKLRDLIANSLKFKKLPEDKQESLILNISKLPEGKENLMISFFEEQNKKEQNPQAIAFLMEKIKEMDVLIKKLALKDKETTEETFENQTEEDLLTSIKNL